MTQRLAVCAPRFGLPSETFITEHVATLAPGRTVLLCNDAEGAAAFGAPVLDRVTPPGPTDALGRLIARARRAVAPGPSRAARARIAAFLREHRVGVVLAEYGTSGLDLHRACREAGVRLAVHFHGFDATALLRHPRIVRRYRAMFPDLHAAITPSRYLADRLVAIGCPEDLIRVNPNGVDPGQFTPSRRAPGRVLAVGRLVDKKAPHLTIEAFAAVAARFPEARLDMVGEGPLRPVCEAVIARHGLQDRVTLHGAQPHARVAALMGDAAVFVQHSVTGPNGDKEGFGISLVEAMSANVPVLATRHNGFVETVVEGETGFLTPEGDVPAMADRLAALLADPARAAAMGEAGRRRMLALYTKDRSRAGLQAILGLTDEA
jgi:glycosyltransferase involved in cell wall biosynthesis